MVTLTLSCAVSKDGYLDDTSERRALLSSPEDLDAVLALRAQMDMIVIGAETLRRDNPSLATRGDDHVKTRQAAGRDPDPIKLVLSRSGNIPADRAFFQTGSAETIVLSKTHSDGPGTRIQLSGDPIETIIDLAQDRGLEDVMIEGGAEILRLALPRAQFLRLAINPDKLNETGHARLFDDPDAFLAEQHILKTETLGRTQVYHIDLLLSRARPLMAQACALSEQCPPSDTAFAVGCLGCSEDLSVLATGYSRQTGPHDHAEEAMLQRLDSPLHTVIVTLEPCLIRASKPTGCAQRLVNAGVKRIIYAVSEDETFTRQAGLAYLAKHGVECLHLHGFEDAFRTANPLIYGRA